MFTTYDIQGIVRQRFKPGSAVVDLKFKEVFRFSMEQDAKVVHAYPSMFRSASKEEEAILLSSGQDHVQLHVKDDGSSR